MRRDLDLLRQLLILIEQSKNGLMAGEVSVEGVDPDDILLHFQLMHDAGLIRSSLDEPDQTHMIDVFATRLTWEGYEFLAAAQNDTIWAKAKAVVKEKGLSITFDLFKLLLIETLKETVLPGKGHA